jgi:ATP-dependent protease HslVU (ClpYQ) peptidase subunit
MSARRNRFAVIRDPPLPLRDASRGSGGTPVTAIVGLAVDGGVHIGGDSAGVAGMSLNVRSDPKVFRRGEYLFGFTTSFRMGQLIRYALAAPKPPKRRLDAFMATTFVDALRDCLKAGGWARKENDREEGGVFLVGVRGELYTIYEDYQVAKAADGFAAVGSGSEVALGALYATQQGQWRPRPRVRVALAAAERFNAGVRGPFVVKSVRP